MHRLVGLDSVMITAASNGLWELRPISKIKKSKGGRLNLNTVDGVSGSELVCGGSHLQTLLELSSLGQSGSAVANSDETRTERERLFRRAKAMPIVQYQ